MPQPEQLLLINTEKRSEVKKTIRDVEVRGKKVLVRADFNVPMDIKSGALTSDTRIRAVLPTIKYLAHRGAKVILCSHLGRPGGKVDQGLRLAPIAQRLSQLLGQAVKTARDCVGPLAEEAIASLKEGEILMLENLRFHPEEEKNDPAFAQALASLADIFVNDAFGTTHRSHASTVGIASYLPAVAGFLIEKELEIMGKALHEPNRPFALLNGGSKVSDKIGILQNILDKVDSLLIGGGMACTFLKAVGYEIGQSLVEQDKLDFATRIMEKAKKKGKRLLLPQDLVVAEHLEAQFEVVSVREIPPTWRIGDIGPQTINAFSDELMKCKTIIWNGPMGIYERPQFAEGTHAMAKVLSQLDATTIIGGGSTAEVVEEMGLAAKMTHVSTGGGASLRFLEGKPLPGVVALLDK
jgi:phosphoglycerate kinase